MVKKPVEQVGAPAAASSAVAKAVTLHLEGKRPEALRELNRAMESGEDSPEVFSARGHLEYELNQYEAAVTSYSRLLDLVPNHPTASFNVAICLEKLGRWQGGCRCLLNAP